MPRFRIFQNDVPTINAGDLIRNKKNKEIYSGVKNAVDNNQMTSEGYTFDSGGCLRSAPSYDAFLALTRGWSLGSIRYEDISNISTSIASDFADPGAAWAQRYNTINLTDYDIVRDASLNSVHNTGGKYAINVIHRDISSVEMNHFLTGSTIKPKTKYSALNPAYSASIQLDPSNILYSTGCSAKSINNNDDAKWKQLVSTQQSSEQYRNNIYRIVKNTDWQFSYPRKFNIKQSRISNSIIPNSTGFTQTIFASGGTITTYTSDGKNYKSHTFTSAGNFVVENSNAIVDFLIVAGGGGGQGRTGGGGGAGGVVVGTSQTLTPGTYAAVIGSGGAGGDAVTYNNNNNKGEDGSDSSFNSFTAKGGGGTGLNGSSSRNGQPGGSGGGGTYNGTGGDAKYYNSSNALTTLTGGSVTIVSGVIAYGYPGGDGKEGSYYPGGGGGGAGAAGQTPEFNTNMFGGNGGDGIANNFKTGSQEWYAGGGGGGIYSSSTLTSVASGGVGGGGSAGTVSDGAGINGTANTGGGGGSSRQADGGAANSGYGGGDGGSGIVVIRYQVS